MSKGVSDDMKILFWIVIAIGLAYVIYLYAQHNLTSFIKINIGAAT